MVEDTGCCPVTACSRNKLQSTCLAGGLSLTGTQQLTQHIPSAFPVSWLLRCAFHGLERKIETRECTKRSHLWVHKEA